MATVLENNHRVPANWHVWIPIIAGLLALYLPTFHGLAYGMWNEDEYAHGPIILAVIMWLIWDKRQILLAPTESTSPKLGIGFLIFGLLIYVLGRSQDIVTLDVGSIFFILTGSLLVVRGWRAVHGYWFMLLFIVYLIPLPGTFVDAATGPLKQYISQISEYILYSAGIPIARNGVVLMVGQYQLLVADACSGINSMFSLSAVGLLYLYLMRHKSWLHNGLIVSSLIPIAFCANLMRVMFLVLVTHYYGDAAGQGFLHKFSGMVVFVVSLALLVLFDTILGKLIKPQKSARTIGTKR